MKYYAADFETTTQKEDCRVWAWGACELHTDNFIYGNSIDSFIEYVIKQENSTFYFHNLKFDGEFILYYFLTHDYTWTQEEKLQNFDFATCIADTGQFYYIKFKRKGKVYTFWDSLKLMNFSIDTLAKNLKLPVLKLELDYEAIREPGHELTEKETEYLKHDVIILKLALEGVRENGLKSMTIGGSALKFYKKILGKKEFLKRFPPPEYDNAIRQSYRGGYTYLKEGEAEKNQGEGIVLDVNSMYPWAMYECMLPYESGVYFSGKYEDDPIFTVYIQMFTCAFKLKAGHLPTFQLKGNLHFAENEYVTSSLVKALYPEKEIYEEITICMTSVDLQLFLEHYDIIGEIIWQGGYKFKATNQLFRPYIDHWMEYKIESEKKGDRVGRLVAKLMLNNLYGKFATNPERASKEPYIENGRVRYKCLPFEKISPVYIPVGSFITAYARDKIIRSAQQLYDRFIYADTDSLHLKGTDFPEGIEIDSYKLGAWKVESQFYKARFLRQKTYIEYFKSGIKFCGLYGSKTISKGKRYKIVSVSKAEFTLQDKRNLSVKCAGLPAEGKKMVNWNNFHRGTVYEGAKLRPAHVEGGIVLEKSDFTIK